MIGVFGRCMAALLLASSSPALAEEAAAQQQASEGEPEVLISRSARSGGWGGPFMQISTVRDRAAVFLGGAGGWLVDGRLTLGGAGFGLATGIPAPPQVERPGQDLDLEMGYGGAWIEYTLKPLRLVHVSFGTLIGGGGISLRWRGGGSYGSGTDGFFVAQPTVLAELNVAAHVRANVGVAYRWIVGAHMAGLSWSDVSGFSAVVALKFGKF